MDFPTLSLDNSYSSLIGSQSKFHGMFLLLTFVWGNKLSASCASFTLRYGTAVDNMFEAQHTTRYQTMYK